MYSVPITAKTDALAQRTDSRTTILSIGKLAPNVHINTDSAIGRQPQPQNPFAFLWTFSILILLSDSDKLSCS